MYVLGTIKQKKIHSINIKHRINGYYLKIDYTYIIVYLW